MSLRSELYDDIYFSHEDGMAESEYVYIEGNRLPQRFRSFADLSPFTVGELGFGAGLNFLLTVLCFRKNAPARSLLHYFSVEKHPLTGSEILDALSSFPLGNDSMKLVRCLRSSSWLLPGFHTMFFDERIRLTILTGEVEEMLSSLYGGTVDAWFADGFSPAKNPAMWTDTVFEQMGRLSTQGTTISTFSAAGSVRRGLERVGFTVEKISGFGSKREMVIGNYSDSEQVREKFHMHQNRRAVVIGGGLAGLSAALMLLRRNWSVEVKEKLTEPGKESSGNPAGLFMPYLTAQPTSISRFTIRACETFISALRVLGLKDLLHLTGIIRRIGQEGSDEGFEETTTRLRKAVASHRIPRSWFRRINANHFLMRKAGWTEPARLCAALVDLMKCEHGERFQLSLNESCETLPEADAVVIAAGTGTTGFHETEFLPIKPVRGQLFVCEAENSRQFLAAYPLLSNKTVGLFAKSLRPFVFENYIIPDEKGWVFGATFEPYSSRRDRDPASDQVLLDRIAEQFPEIGIPMKNAGFIPDRGRTGFRSQSRDYVPVIGPLPDFAQSIKALETGEQGELPLVKNVFVHGGFGSRGIMSSMLAAEILASYINGEVLPVEMDLAEELLAHRFIRRAARKRRQG